jgi:hypothetical protein
MLNSSASAGADERNNQNPFAHVDLTVGLKRPATVEETAALPSSKKPKTTSFARGDSPFSSPRAAGAHATTLWSTTTSTSATPAATAPTSNFFTFGRAQAREYGQRPQNPTLWSASNVGPSQDGVKTLLKRDWNATAESTLPPASRVLPQGSASALATSPLANAQWNGTPRSEVSKVHISGSDPSSQEDLDDTTPPSCVKTLQEEFEEYVEEFKNSHGEECKPRAIETIIGGKHTCCSRSGGWMKRRAPSLQCSSVECGVTRLLPSSHWPSVGSFSIRFLWKGTTLVSLRKSLFASTRTKGSWCRVANLNKGSTLTAIRVLDRPTLYSLRRRNQSHRAVAGLPFYPSS